MKHKLVVAAATMAMLSTSALAADPEVYENPFNGFYMGVHGGYGWAKSDVDYDFSINELVFLLQEPIEGPPEVCVEPCPEETVPDLGGNYSLDADGALLGAQAGANFVMSNGFLLGAEVSGSWSAIKGSKSFSPLSSILGGEFEGEVPGNLEADVENELSALGLAQAKLGWANDKFAVYGSGGFALGQFSRSVDVDGLFAIDPECLPECAALISGSSDQDEMLSGWTVGAGLEVMVTEHVSLGTSYNYVRFDYDDSFDLNVASAIGRSGGEFPIGEVEAQGDMDIHVVKANLNYHF